jgi:hypothetical protein
MENPFEHGNENQSSNFAKLKMAPNKMKYSKFGMFFSFPNQRVSKL